MITYTQGTYINCLFSEKHLRYASTSAELVAFAKEIGYTHCALEHPFGAGESLFRKGGTSDLNVPNNADEFIGSYFYDISQLLPLVDDTTKL